MESVTSATEWLMSTQGRGIHRGLDRMNCLLALLGNPEKNLRCLHVAGTNGKGSVCAFSESILRTGGLRTGLYTSPHLVDFTERIRIAGEMITPQELELRARHIWEVTRNWQMQDLPTFFELTTALAFDFFARSACDVVVLETGLGGRLDATNTALKIACAMTSISYDHTALLGNTLEMITREKAGIFRPDVPAIIAPQPPEVVTTIEEFAQQTGTPCIWIHPSDEDDYFSRVCSIPLPLTGSHQRSNAAVALAMIESAGFKFSNDIVSRGLANTTWSGRFQCIKIRNSSGEGRLILDGAHNLHAVKQLISIWHEEFPKINCRLIFGALSDKDPELLLAELSVLASEILLVPINSPRSADPKQLAAKLTTLGIRIQVLESTQAAMEEVMNGINSHSLSSQAPVLVTGSLFLVGEALAWLSELEGSLGIHEKINTAKVF